MAKVYGGGTLKERRLGYTMIDLTVKVHIHSVIII